MGIPSTADAIPEHSSLSAPCSLVTYVPPNHRQVLDPGSQSRKPIPAFRSKPSRVSHYVISQNPRQGWWCSPPRDPLELQSICKAEEIHGPCTLRQEEDAHLRIWKAIKNLDSARNSLTLWICPATSVNIPSSSAKRQLSLPLKHRLSYPTQPRFNPLSPLRPPSYPSIQKIILPQCPPPRRPMHLQPLVLPPLGRTMWLRYMVRIQDLRFRRESLPPSPLPRLRSRSTPQPPNQTPGMRSNTYASSQFPFSFPFWYRSVLSLTMKNRHNQIASMPDSGAVLTINPKKRRAETLSGGENPDSAITIDSDTDADADSDSDAEEVSLFFHHPLFSLKSCALHTNCLYRADCQHQHLQCCL